MDNTPIPITQDFDVTAASIGLTAHHVQTKYADYTHFTVNGKAVGIGDSDGRLTPYCKCPAWLTQFYAPQDIDAFAEHCIPHLVRLDRLPPGM